jgi:hypothetical protein
MRELFISRFGKPRFTKVDLGDGIVVRLRTLTPTERLQYDNEIVSVTKKGMKMDMGLRDPLIVAMTLCNEPDSDDPALMFSGVEELQKTVKDSSVIERLSTEAFKLNGMNVEDTEVPNG